MIDNAGYLYPEKRDKGREDLRVPIAINCCGSKRFSPEITFAEGLTGVWIISFSMFTVVPDIICFRTDGRRWRPDL